MIEEKTNQKQVRRKFSPEFKDQVLLRAEKDGVATVAADLGVKESMIYSWRAKRKSGGTTLENQKIQQVEMNRLKREVDRLTTECDFLKKAAAYFAKDSKLGAP
jgi:transposase